MGDNKTLNVVIIVCFVLLIGMGAFILIDQVKLPDSYVYEGPTGAFTFIPDQKGDIIFHNLYLTAKDEFISKRLGIDEGRKIIIPFRYGPKEVEDIGVSNESVYTILTFDKMLNKDKGIYLTLDPYEDSALVLSVVEIARVIGTADYGVFQIPTEIAYIKNYEGDERIVKLCNESDYIQGIIHFTLGAETKVFNVPEFVNCVVVEGKDYNELIRATDALIYNLLGVMNTTKSNEEVMDGRVHLKNAYF